MSPGHDITRAAIVDHPLYNGLVLTHINIMKVILPNHFDVQLKRLA